MVYTDKQSNNIWWQQGLVQSKRKKPITDDVDSAIVHNPSREPASSS
jgi:hypothetical protein